MVGHLLYALCFFSFDRVFHIELEVRLVASKLALTVLWCPVPKLWSYWHHLSVLVLLVNIYTYPLLDVLD